MVCPLTDHHHQLLNSVIPFMNAEMFTSPRKSNMQLGEVYFWTNTIKDWKKLLKPDKYKQVILEQLQWLVEQKKIAVYGFVIMPNHLHLIWEMLQMNGKEMPYASLNKWTSSSFLRDLRQHHPLALSSFVEDTKERKHRFWQRDPLAVLLPSKQLVEQKLEYVHLNPLQEHWQLALRPEDYLWSSANFYATGKDSFSILTHYQDRF